MKRGFKILAVLVVAVSAVSALTLAWSTPAAASAQYPSGPYWYAEFFNARWPTAMPVYTRYDTSINFDWGTGSPNAAVPVDNFSARWTRTVDFVGGVYKLWVVHDDGVLLWVDDKLIINQWYDQPAYLEYSDPPMVPNLHFETVSLTAGPHRIKLEYYEHGKNAVVRLGWVPVRLAPTADPYLPSTLHTHQIHIVRPGEWLYKIARIYGVSVHAIIEANSLSSHQLVPGQRLIIPGAISWSGRGADCHTRYTVRPGDNLFRISLRFDVSVDAMAAWNGISPPYTVHVGQALCVP
jgi:LysM repeat protein